MSAGGFRRLLPPPRRRPTLLAVLVRWRAELLIGGCVAAAWQVGNGLAVQIGALVLAVLVAFVPQVRRAAVGLAQALVVPHRLRAALAQAGVADRTGRLPWIVAARPRGDAVWVSVWLRAGTTVGDLEHATPLIAGACGAAHVVVLRRTVRQDRAVVLVQRPRWGWPGR